MNMLGSWSANEHMLNRQLDNVGCLAHPAHCSNLHSCSRPVQ